MAATPTWSPVLSLPRPPTAVLAALAAVALLAGGIAPAAARSPGPPLQAALVAGMPTTLTLAATPAEVAYGRTGTLTGRLSDPVTGSGVAGATVHLETRAASGGWGVLAVLVTDAGGSVSSTQTPGATTAYRLRHGEPGAPEASTSPQATVRVHPRLTGAVSRQAVRVGRPVTVTGTLAPGVGGVGLWLERRSGGRWVRLARARTVSDGSYSVTTTASAPGFWRLRVRRAAGADRPGSTVRLPAVDAFRLHRYSVSTRGRIRADLRVFRAQVAAIYDDPRGWARAHHRFRAVGRGGGPAEFSVVLSEARYLPWFSSVCSTTYSCRVGRYVIINQDRWRRGSPYFPGTLEQYRRMLLNHETGHWLGRGHAFCGGRGRPAPVMQQQSKGMHGCRVNPWPLPYEIRAVS